MAKQIKPKATNVTGKIARAERPHKGLSKTQEELAELAADMLMNGGGTPEIKMLLRALDQHEYRRFITDLYKGSKPPAEVQAMVDEKNVKYGPAIDRWYRQLLTEWPEQPPVQPRESGADNASRAVKDIARAGVKRQLQDAFEQFLLHREGLEAHWLLNEILEEVASGSFDLAEAFTVVFDRDDTYVRVPWNFRKKVKEFIALLGKEAA